MCQQHVSYLRDVGTDTLKLWYNMSNEYHYEIDEMVFKLNAKTDYIFVVMQGVVSIELSNGYEDHIIDLLGRGSIIQIANIIFDELSYYQARSVSA